MSMPQPAGGTAVAALLADAMNHHRAGRLADALAHYARVLALDPDHADALNLTGMARLAAGDAAGALEPAARAVKLQPRSPLFHFNLGKAQAAAGQQARASASFDRALRLKPDMAEAWTALGILRATRGEERKAAHALRRAIAAAPEQVEAWNNLGLVLARLGDLDEARRTLDRALELRPDFAVAHNSAAVLARDMGDLPRALDHLERAITLAPAYIEARANLAVTLNDLRRFDDAVAAFDAALTAQPARAETWRASAKPLLALGEIARARAACERAHALAPDDRRNLWERALIDLGAGDFAAGWDGYRARPTIDHDQYPMPQQKLPDDLTGRSLVLDGEQGLGEELFFLRFAAALAARGAHIQARVDTRLVAMTARMDFMDTAMARKGRAPGAIALGDLPWLAGACDIAPPPAAIPALAPLREQMRTRLAAAGPPPYLALTWRAGLAGRKTLFKEVPTDLIAAAARQHPDATLIALQRQPVAGEIAALAARTGRPIADFTDLNDDLESALAALYEIDTYIAVSNTNVHLAAAARAGGAPIRVHVLVPCPAEFRWLARGEESPWFPGFAVHREDARHGWPAAIRGI